MFKNYLKIALRNIKKNKTHSIINISGLAIGMACFIFIALYIKYELSYDKFHKNSEQIYRIDLKQDYTNVGSYFFNTTPAPLAEALRSDYPGIENVTRLRKEARSLLIHTGKNTFLEEDFFYTDPDFLEMFSFPLVAGNPKTALNDPYSIILTEDIAHKYFGNENPIGGTITVNQKHQQQPYIVTGVMKNPLSNSHLKFSLLASLSTLYKQQGSENQEHSIH
jgi:putative ABC transport system permease protein